MAADIINLRRARKLKARAEADSRAADNRLRFGLGKAARREAEAKRALADRHLEGHKLPGPSSRDE